MKRMRFSLYISAEKYQAYYRGSAKFIRVQSEDGRMLKFPADKLQQFVSHNGIEGRFEITFDDNFKLLGLRRV